MSNTIDNQTGSSISLASFVITDKDGDGYSMLDILNEAEAVQGDVTKAKASMGSLGEHMMLMAAKAAEGSVFRALCEMAEETKKWGKAPKGSPVHIRNLYHAAPNTYTQYKSKILRAMDAGILPMTEAILTRTHKPNKFGLTTTEEIVVLDTVNKLNAARQQAEPEGTKEKAGVVVDSKGEQHLPKVKDSVLMANLINDSLGKVLGDISVLFENAPIKEQDKAIKALQALAKRLEKVQPEVKEKAQQVA